MSVDVNELITFVDRFLEQENYRYEKTSSCFFLEFESSEHNMTLSVEISFIYYRNNNGECCIQTLARNPLEIRESRKQDVLEYILRAGCDSYEGYFALVPNDGTNTYQVVHVNHLFVHSNIPSFDDVEQCLGVAIARAFDYFDGLYNVAIENGNPLNEIQQVEQ